MDDDDFEIVPAIDPFAAENAANKSKSEIKPRKKFVHPKATPEARKELKEKSRLRKARIILRNVSYKVNESNLKERFAKYGEIREVNILKRPDGKLVGCAFIQFDKVNHAAKAIHHENAKEFLGRPVVIDWAVNQKKFISHLKKQRHEIKKESDNVEIKSEEESDGENAGENDSVEEKSASDNNNNEATSEEEEDENDDNDDVDGEEDGEDSDADKKDEKKPIHKLSNDVAEGCTVFIKNVPFEATNEDLRKVCSQFGPLYYAVITKDKVSGHSKGNGFVKFKTKESADLCANAGTAFTLFDQILDPHPALSRHEMKRKADETKKEPKDSRNLYLAKEGLIVAGTRAAEGVSASDMAKRLQLERSTNQLLKNLNRFVAKDRLSIHNIPISWDNAKLRKAVVKACNLKPKECRIMRENKPSLGHPLGKSKGFGFLSFETHDEALQCLRKVNNNPTVFGKNNRPIVAFSIEDRAALNVKMKRLKRSQECNPLNKKNYVAQPPKNAKDVKPNVKKLKEKKNKKTVTANGQGGDDFIGVTTEKGSEFKSRPMWKMREDATTHQKQLKENKKSLKKKKLEQAIKNEKRQIDRPKMGKRKLEVDGALVNKYLKMLHAKDEIKGEPKLKRSKWYTD